MLRESNQSVSNFNQSRRNLLISTPFLLAATQLGAKTNLAQPTQAALLRVDGDIELTNAGDAAVFDAQMLDALPQISFTTSTISTDKPRTFSGPALFDVLKHVGSDAAQVTATAANNYSVDIDSALIEERAPIIANRIDGKAFSIRKKGPIWVVFPYDEDPKYHTEPIYAVNVWQLERLTVTQI